MTWKPIETFGLFQDELTQLDDAAHEILGFCETGSIGDRFGGCLFYTYLPPDTSNETLLVQPAFLDDLEKFNARIKDEKLVKDLAIEARKQYAAKLNDKILRAFSELAREVTDPLYKAAGIRIKWTEVIYEKNNYLGSHGKPTFVRQEIKDGVAVRRVVKQISRGRPPVWTRAKLEQKIRSAVKAFRKRKYRSPTIAEAANELKMPVATLKKLLQRHGLLYSAYKKET